MINDTENLLLGLYRESTYTKTIDETSSKIIKKVHLAGKGYLLTEEKIDRSFVWKVFNEHKLELSREEIVNLYAEANLRRQMIKKN